jgi:membrane-bound lytic murein transglycosylase A
MWLETRLPQVAGNDSIFHQLMIAQDTGTAIRNRIRGDIFFGPGEDAAALAGHMQSPGHLYALLPKPLTRRLGIGK